MKNNYLNLFETYEQQYLLTTSLSNDEPFVGYTKDCTQTFYNPQYIQIGNYKWATKLLGASSSSSHDAFIYQWGEIVGNNKTLTAGTGTTKVYNWTNTPFNDGNFDPSNSAWTKYVSSILDSEYNLTDEYDISIRYLSGSTPLKGYHYRTPTIEELADLTKHRLKLTNTIVYDMFGQKIIIGDECGLGVTDEGTSGMCFSNVTVSNKSILFIPFRGSCDSDSGMWGYNTSVNLWSKTSSLVTTAINYYKSYKYAQGIFLGFIHNKLACGLANNPRADGYCCLPILVKDK